MDFKYRALFLSAVVWSAIHLTIHTGTKAVQLSVFSEKQVVVPSSSNIFYLKSIGEHLDWLFCMHIHRVANAQLTIFVKAYCENPALLCQKNTVKFPTRRLLYLLSVKVRLCRLNTSVRNLLNFYCSWVPVEDLSVLRVLVLVFAKLESWVLTHSIGRTALWDVNSMLKTKTKIHNFYFR